jgi:hypothetical protein
MPKHQEADLFIYKSGTFNLNAMYKEIRAWFGKNKFVPFEGVYKDKTSGYIGRELTDEWKASRKVTGYIRYWIYIEIKAWDIVDVEVQVGDKKVKKQKTRIRIEIKSEIVTDWEERFEENAFLRKIRAFYEKYILKKELETKYETELLTLTYDLHARLKNHLEMEAK